MHQFHERFLSLMSSWFKKANIFQNEVMPLLHGLLELLLAAAINWSTLPDSISCPDTLISDIQPLVWPLYM